MELEGTFSGLPIVPSATTAYVMLSRVQIAVDTRGCKQFCMVEKFRVVVECECE